MSAEDDIADALTRHQIFVLRYARGREREAEDFVSRTLLSVISRLEEDDLTTLTRERYQDKARDLYQYLRASNSDYADEFLDEMRRFAGYESDFNTSLGQKNLDVDFNKPAPIQLQQAVFADIMGLEPTQGYTIRGMLDQYGRQGANLVVDQIRESITLGETTQQLTSKIRSLIPTQQRKAATVARTAVNHVAVQARKESMKENDDVLDGYKWLATLDSRTSMICMARDGTIYRDYDKDPKPPAHFNCRSTITYIVKPEFDIGADIVGTRPAKGSSGTKSVKADLTYDAWLRTQSKAFQISVLGRSRAQLFRDGLTLDRFVDNRGNMLTLEQLSGQDALLSGLQQEIPIPVAPRRAPAMTDNVLPSVFTTGTKDYRSGLNSVFNEINTEEMALLQEFTQSKGIKSLVLKSTQMSRNAKSARAISGDVGAYLLDDPNPEESIVEMFGSSRYGSSYLGVMAYTVKKPKNCNGFTSSAYRHVVLKEKSKAKFSKPQDIADRIKRSVSSIVNNTDAKQEWSFSHVVGRDYKDEAGEMSITMLHELGHQVHYYAGAPKFPDQLKSARLTKYGAYNDAESHAELFVAWVVDRAGLARKSPQLAEYFDQLMKTALSSNTRGSTFGM